MIALNNGIVGIVGLAFVSFFVLMMVVLQVIKRQRPGRDLRPLQAFSRLRQATHEAVEAGQRMHISLGRGEITHARTASAFAGLSAAENLIATTAASDAPAIITTGTGPLGILARSTLHRTYTEANQEDHYRPDYGQVTGLTPFSYAAGVALLGAQDKKIAASFLSGSFGPEVGFIIDGLAQHDTLVVGGTDNLAAQAVLYAAADEALIGEEVFASGAYLDMGGLHSTSLLTQDIFRWLLILVILGGAAAKMLGVLP